MFVDIPSFGLAVEQSLEEETATVHDGIRDQRTPASDGRLGAVLQMMVDGRGDRDFKHATC